MAKKKTTKRKGSFLSRVQKTPKIVAIRKKIRKALLAKKKLSMQYKRLVKSESKRLSK